MVEHMSLEKGWCHSCNRLLEPASKTRWEHYQDKLSFIEYLKLQKISLLQDIDSQPENFYILQAKLEEINNILNVSIEMLDI